MYATKASELQEVRQRVQGCWIVFEPNWTLVDLPFDDLKRKQCDQKVGIYRHNYQFKPQAKKETLQKLKNPI
jgi:hypothetical protein